MKTCDSRALSVATGSAVRCSCCLAGHPIRDGWHIPTQAMGMIPATKCTLVQRGDVARFRAHLNAQDGGVPHKHNRYHQKTRLYGDYLYAQDREKFMVNMREWLIEQNAGNEPRSTERTKI